MCTRLYISFHEQVVEIKRFLQYNRFPIYLKNRVIKNFLDKVIRLSNKNSIGFCRVQMKLIYLNWIQFISNPFCSPKRSKYQSIIISKGFSCQSGVKGHSGGLKGALRTLSMLSLCSHYLRLFSMHVLYMLADLKLYWN